MICPQINTIHKTQVSGHLCFQNWEIICSADETLMIGVREESSRELDYLLPNDVEDLLIRAQESSELRHTRRGDL
jgi:hypothetical protein